MTDKIASCICYTFFFFLMQKQCLGNNPRSYSSLLYKKMYRVRKILTPQKKNIEK